MAVVTRSGSRGGVSDNAGTKTAQKTALSRGKLPDSRAPMLAVFSLAAASRIILLLILAFCAFIAPSYDTSATLTQSSAVMSLTSESPFFKLKKDQDSAQPSSQILNLTGRMTFFRALTTALDRWDSVHFTDFALRNYATEQGFAFFPGLPLAARTANSLLVTPAIDLFGMSGVSPRQRVLLSSAIVSCICFSAMCYLILKILEIGNAMPNTMNGGNHTKLGIFPSSRITLLALILAPANVFLTVGYSEALFGVLSVGCMVLAVRGHTISAAILSGLACSIRSNGALLAVLFVFPCWVQKLVQLVRSKEQSTSSTGTPMFNIRVVFHLLKLCLAAPVSVVGLLLYNWYSELLFCGLGEQSRPWCGQSGGLYAYVQAVYWNVGLFKYWNVSQIPNFLLAMPILVIAADDFLYTSRLLVNDLFHQKQQTPLSVFMRRWACAAARVFEGSSSGWISNAIDSDGAKYISLRLAWRACMCGHLAFLCAFGLFVAHVQITTRMVSGCPAVYFCIARLIENGGLKQRLVLKFCAAYTAMGCVLFSTFLPWT